MTKDTAPLVERLKALRNSSSQARALTDAAHLAGLSDEANTRPRGHGKAEWVFKWLLETLERSAAKDSTSFASNPDSWSLLTKLLDHVLVVNATKLLQQHSIIQIATRTITNNVETGLENPLTNGSLKRKRETEVPHCVLSIANLMQEISIFFGKVQYLSNKSPESMDEVEGIQWRSTLHVSMEIASNLLGGIFKAASLLVGQAMNPRTLDLVPVIDIWNLRQIANDDEVASAKVFSLNVLIPTLGLYGQLSQMVDTTAAKFNLFTVAKEQLVILEELLSNHLLKPLRNSFISRKRQKWDGDLLAEMKDILAPLKLFIFHHRGESHCQFALYAIPKLYSLAARISGLPVAKSRALDEAWLEHFLRIMASCTGEYRDSANVEGPLPERSHPPNLVLERLLTVVKYHNIPLSSNVLSWLLFQTSGLFHHSAIGQPNPQTVRWSIITKAMDVDGAIFVDHQFSTPDSQPAHYLNIRPLLFNKVAELRFQATNPSNVDDVAQNREQFVTQVMFKLVDTHSRLRKLHVFISKWFEMLRFQFEVISTPNHEPTACTSELLVAYVSNCCRADVTLDIAGLIRGYSIELEGNPDLAFAKSSSVPAALVVLEALFGAVKEMEEWPLLFQEVTAWLSTILTLGAPILPLEARIWRLLTLLQLYRTALPGVPDRIADPLPALESVVTKIEQDPLEDGSQTWSSTIESLLSELLTFLTTSMMSSSGNDGPTTDDARLIRRSFAAILNTEMGNATWKFTSPQGIIVQAARIAAKHPHILLMLDEETRAALFLAILFFARTMQEFDKALLFRAMSESISKAGSQNLHSRWFDGLVAATQPQNVRIGDSPIARVDLITIAEHVSVESLQRHQRDRILSIIRPKAYEHDEHQVYEDLDKRLLLIDRLGCGDFETSCMILEPKAIFSLAAAVDDTWPKCPPYQSFNQYRRIVHRVLRSLLEATKEAAFRKLLCDEICEAEDRILLSLRNRIAVLALIAEACSVQVANSDLITCEKCRKTLTGMAITAINLTLEQNNLDSTSLNPLIYSLLLDVISGLSHNAGFDMKRDEISSLLEPIVNLVSDEDWISLFSGDGYDPYKPELYMSAITLANNLRRSIQLDEVQGLNMTRLIQKVVNKPELNPTVKNRLLFKYRDDSRSQPHLQTLIGYRALNSSSKSALMMRHLEIETIAAPKAQSFVKKTTMQLLSNLSDDLESAGDFSLTLIVMKSLQTILKAKEVMVDQYGIESVLKALYTLCGQSDKNLHQEGASTLYAEICQIISILLLRYRKRLGERMQLLVPLMEKLLSCLVVLHPKSNAPKQQRPSSWLSSSYGMSNQENAASYSRILYTLSRPTVSSVSKRSIKPTTVLTDETRKAREYAAEFVPYLLVHYCGLQLVGKLFPEICTILTPAIFSCIEIVPHEKLVGMSASMGRDEREIWRSLWAEWRKSQGLSA